MFSSEYCEIFKDAYFEEYLLTAASDFLKQLQRTAVRSCIDSFFKGTLMRFENLPISSFSYEKNMLKVSH